MHNVLLGTALVFKLGGVRSHILTLQKALEQDGHQASLLALEPIKVSDVLIAGIKAFGSREQAYTELVKARAKKAFSKTNLLVMEKKFNLIHAHDVVYGNCLINQKVPFVLTVHGPMSREAKMLYKSSEGKCFFSYLVNIERETYKKADHIIAVDTGQRDIIVNDYNIDPSRITVILNAVEAVQKKNIDEHKNSSSYFLVPRNLVPKNGIAVAIKAMSLYKNKENQLWIAGEGPEYKELTKLADKYSLNERVRFLGHVEHAKMLQMMQSAKAVLIPSVPIEGVIEASSIAALEAMSLGVPVIASDIGGLKEMIRNRYNGLLFEPGNAQELALLMDEIENNSELKSEISLNAINYIDENHNTNAWLEKILAVYSKILSEHQEAK